jgi:hypothetical protein
MALCPAGTSFFFFLGGIPVPLPLLMISYNLIEQSFPVSLV